MGFNSGFKGLIGCGRMKGRRERMQVRQHLEKCQTNWAVCSDLRLENHIFQNIWKCHIVLFFKTFSVPIKYFFIMSIFLILCNATAFLSAQLFGGWRMSTFALHSNHRGAQNSVLLSAASLTNGRTDYWTAQLTVQFNKPSTKDQITWAEQWGG